MKFDRNNRSYSTSRFISNGNIDEFQTVILRTGKKILYVICTQKGHENESDEILKKLWIKKDCYRR